MIQQMIHKNHHWAQLRDMISLNHMKKKLMVLSGLFFALAPIAAFAQVTINGSDTSCNSAAYNGASATLFGLLCRIGNFLNAIVPVLVALGVVYFVWGVVTYVIASDEEA